MGNSPCMCIQEWGCGAMLCFCALHYLQVERSSVLRGGRQLDNRHPPVQSLLCSDRISYPPSSRDGRHGGGVERSLAASSFLPNKTTTAATADFSFILESGLRETIESSQPLPFLFSIPSFHSDLFFFILFLSSIAGERASVSL